MLHHRQRSDDLLQQQGDQGGARRGANSDASLIGSDKSSSYQGILFYADRSLADQTPDLGGGGALSLIGTIYLPTQTLSFSGHGGSATTLQGEIVVNDLTMGGNGSITMKLDSTPSQTVSQVALVK